MEFKQQIALYENMEEYDNFSDSDARTERVRTNEIMLWRIHEIRNDQ